MTGLNIDSTNTSLPHMSCPDAYVLQASSTCSAHIALQQHTPVCNSSDQTIHAVCNSDERNNSLADRRPPLSGLLCLQWYPKPLLRLPHNTTTNHATCPTNTMTACCRLQRNMSLFSHQSVLLQSRPHQLPSTTPLFKCFQPSGKVMVLAGWTVSVCAAAGHKGASVLALSCLQLVVDQGTQLVDLCTCE